MKKTNEQKTLEMMATAAGPMTLVEIGKKLKIDTGCYMK